VAMARLLASRPTGSAFSPDSTTGVHGWLLSHSRLEAGNAAPSAAIEHLFERCHPPAKISI